MLEIDRPGRRSLWLAAAAVVLAAGIGAGIAVGYAIRGPSVDSLKTANQLQQEELAEVATQLDLRQSSIDALTGERQSLEERLGDLREELREQTGKLQSRLDERIESIETLELQVTELENRPPVLDVEGLAELRGQLEADRLLLVELRREDPETREDAERYWATIKRIAVTSDPALTPKADEVARDLPAYYSWLERDFVSTREAQISYLLTGASAYNESVDGFWSAFLMVLIDRIDTLGRLEDERGRG